MNKTPSKEDFASLVLRLGVATIILWDGFVKIASRGGAAWDPHFATGLNLVVTWGEVVFGLALAIGLCTRLSAVVIAGIMVGAIFLVSKNLPDVSPGVGNLATAFSVKYVGYEYFLNFVVTMICLALAIQGGGRLAVDYCLCHLKKAMPFIPPIPESRMAGV